MNIYLRRCHRTAQAESYFIFSDQPDIGCPLPDNSSARSRLGRLYVFFESIAEVNSVDLFLEGELSDEVVHAILDVIRNNLLHQSNIYPLTVGSVFSMTDLNQSWEVNFDEV